jgi:hypothetical protein
VAMAGPLDPIGTVTSAISTIAGQTTVLPDLPGGGSGSGSGSGGSGSGATDVVSGAVGSVTGSPAAAAPGQAGRQEALAPPDRSPQADQAAEALGGAEAPAGAPVERGPTRDSTVSPIDTRDCSSESSSDATSAQASLAFASSSPPRPRRFAPGCCSSSATRSTDSRRAV